MSQMLPWSTAPLPPLWLLQGIRHGRHGGGAGQALHPDDAEALGGPFEGQADPHLREAAAEERGRWPPALVQQRGRGLLRECRASVTILSPTATATRYFWRFTFAASGPAVISGAPERIAWNTASACSWAARSRAGCRVSEGRFAAARASFTRRRISSRSASTF